MTLVINRENGLWAVTAYITKTGVVFGYAKRKDREEVLMLVVKMVLDAFPDADVELIGDLPEEVTSEQR